jgi:hypothetical protein
MSYPAIRNGAASQDDTNKTSHTVNLIPGYMSAGDLLLMWFANDGTATASATGWTQLKTKQTASNTARLTVLYRIATGSEGSTITVTTTSSEMSAAYVVSIRADSWFGTAAGFEVSTGATGTSAYPDPDSLTPTWGAGDTMWWACGVLDERYNLTEPDDWGGPYGFYLLSTVAGGVTVFGWDRYPQTGGASIDPGTTTSNGSDEWAAFTIGIRAAVTPQTVSSPTPIAATEALYQPAATSKAALPTIAATEALYQPTIAQSVAAQAIASTVAVATPAGLTLGTAPPVVLTTGIAATEALGEPTITEYPSQDVWTQVIVNLPGIEGPALTVGVATVVPDVLAATEALHAPAKYNIPPLTVATEALPSTRAVHTPGVTGVPLALALPFALDIYDGAALTTMLATLEGARNRSFTDPFGEVGSGAFVMSASDPKATAAILASGNLVKCKIGNSYRYAWWIENPKRRAASPKGAGGEDWRIGGRGAIAMLDRGVVYPPGWPTPTGAVHSFTNARAGAILRQFILAAQARGALAGMTVGWTDTHDSGGAPWTDTLTIEVKALTSLLALEQQLVALGYEFTMSPDLRLDMYPAKGADLSGTVILRAGKHLRDAVERNTQDAGLKTRVLVEGADGVYQDVPGTIPETGAIGRREGGVSFGQSTSTTTLTQIGQATLETLALARDAVSLPVLHGGAAGEFEPYLNYSPGDWVAVDVAGTYDREKVRVAGITVEDGDGDFEVELDLNSTAVDAEIRLKRLLDALGAHKVTEGDIDPGVIPDPYVPPLPDPDVVTVRHGASFPAGPEEGDYFYLDSDNNYYRYTGSSWIKSITFAEVTGTLATARLEGTIAANQILSHSITTEHITTLGLSADVIKAGELNANLLDVDTSASIRSLTVWDYFRLRNNGVDYLVFDTQNMNLYNGAAIFWSGHGRLWGSDGRIRCNTTVYADHGFATYQSSGAIGGDPYPSMAVNGMLATDYANLRIYGRFNGAWKGVACTLGFQVPVHERICPACGDPLLPGDNLIGRGDREMSDGALHGLWVHFKCASKPTDTAIADSYWQAAGFDGGEFDPPAAEKKARKDFLAGLVQKVKDKLKP